MSVQITEKEPAGDHESDGQVKVTSKAGKLYVVKCGGNITRIMRWCEGRDEERKEKVCRRQ